jgi:hypothetical protein
VVPDSLPPAGRVQGWAGNVCGNILWKRPLHTFLHKNSIRFRHRHGHDFRRESGYDSVPVLGYSTERQPTIRRSSRDWTIERCGSGPLDGRTGLIPANQRQFCFRGLSYQYRQHCVGGAQLERPAHLEREMTRSAVLF